MLVGGSAFLTGMSGYLAITVVFAVAGSTPVVASTTHAATSSGRAPGAAAVIASQQRHRRVVDRYSASWALPASPAARKSEPPLNEPAFPSGPFAGNGDVSLLYVGNGTASHRKGAIKVADWQQWMFLSKNDMWGSDSVSYYPHLSAGRVGFAITPPGAGTTVNASIHMFPGNASIVHTLNDPSGDASVSATTRVLESNVIATELVCTSKLGGVCPTKLLLSDTNNNHFAVDQSVGSSPDRDLVWWRKENLHQALNPAYVGSCDPHVPLQSTERRFTVGASGDLRMANGSCLWYDEYVAQDIITSGACSQPQGSWKWVGNASNGDVVHYPSSKCLMAGDGGVSKLKVGACGSMPWTQAPSGSANASHVYLAHSAGRGASTPQCLIVVPDNNNNTLGVALGITDAQGSLLKGEIARVDEEEASAGISLSVSLRAGARYTLLVGVQTLRDTGCAGIRPQWMVCTRRPQDAAASLVRTVSSPSEFSAAVARSETFWSSYWNASSVDIAGSPSANASRTVERWYYLAQYLLGSITRDGKVTPALDGFACVEPVPWGDQFTLDYNLESTFWGAGSSNRIEFIHPVMASATNPGALATAHLRAQNPGTWNRKPHWPGHVGATVPGAECVPECPNLTATGFRGAEWPAAAMPLGDSRLANNDLQSRFSGGLLATNLIQYWEYTQNLTTLRERIYPFVKDNAEFYLSYAVQGRDGKLMFPYSCAQEDCHCRDAGFIKETDRKPLPNSTVQCKGPQAPYQERCPGRFGWELNHACYQCMPYIATGSADGYHNSHPDLAFAASSFRNAIRFAKILGIDSTMAAAWQTALDSMPEYPSADLTFIDGARGSEFNGGAGLFVEAEYGHHEDIYPKNSSGVTPIVWPWCNTEYAISTFAAMWPTDEIGITQTSDGDLVARAKQTVFALAKYQGISGKGGGNPFAPRNGFGLSWPPAVRLSGREEAEELVSAFAVAVDHLTGNNGCGHQGGGMLENIGATQAINDLLLQSQGGRMRFFPVWNATALGAASFTSLRAYGAFVVSGAVDTNGMVAPVSLESEVGGDVVFESPWTGSAAPMVTSEGADSVPTTLVSPGVYSFASKAGGKYIISSPS